MIKIRLIVVSAVAMVTLGAIGEPVVVVNGFKLTREALFDSAEKTMRFSGGRYDGLSGFDAWNRLVEDILLDFKIGTIATLELQSRGIKIPYGGYKQFDINDSRRYFPRSHVAAAYAQDYAVTMLAKGDFGSEVVDRSVKQQLVDRYQAKYSVTEIGLRDLLDSYGSVSTGTFVKGDNYEASLEELDKDAGMFTKCAYYIHRYTIRYYVIGLRWYVGKVDKMALGALVNGDKRKWEIIKFVGYFLLPYSLLMVIAVTTYRRSGGGMSFKPLFACVNFLYLYGIRSYTDPIRR